ncbi:MAG TPA: hypothetical protein VE962_08105 [Actinomycetota bacterium]|nr:hypothetical protein [Actinomycetota bacterium]
MEPNRVAREFWTELLDVRAEVRDGRERRPAKARQKRVRRAAAPRQQARSS